MQVRAQEQWLLLERIGLALIVSVFLASLMSRAVSWDWVMDTLFLGVAATLVLQGFNSQAETTNRNRWPLLLCGYLFVDSVFLFLVDLRSFAGFTFLYLLLSVLYGRALQLRARSSLPQVEHPLGSLFAPPFRVFTILGLVALLCMALPMTQVAWGFSAWSGPMVVAFHNVTVMNAGRTVRFGGAVAQYGYQIAFGHPVCIVLIGLVLLPALRAAGLVSEGVIRFVRGALVAVLVWWVFFARGFQSLLGYPATLLFLVAVMTLTVFAFRRATVIQPV